jgi:hypothetical protein
MSFNYQKPTMQANKQAVFLNKKYSTTYINQPYPIWIIDNFLKPKILKSILNEWPEETDSRWHHGHDNINGKPNILEQKMLGISKKEDMSSHTRSVMEYFHSTEFCKILEKITQIKSLIPDSSWRWSGLRIMLPESFQLIHSDARYNPETGFRKELTCLLYLNSDYIKARDEGCLEIWTDDMGTRTHEIEPILNRMTIFLNSDTAYHGVPLVKSSRKALTFSVLKQGDVGPRSKALFVKRPQDSVEIQEVGLERSQIRDKK